MDFRVNRTCLFIHDIDIAREIEATNILKSFDADILAYKLEILRKAVPDRNSSLLTVQRFIDELSRIWFSTLGIDQNIVTLSKGEIDSLNNYFYANELIVRCKEAAVRVSPDTWAGIEDRMLRVID